jgi:hypothetical protein
MRLTLPIAFAAALSIAAHPAGAGDAPPLYKTSKDWSGYCLSSGVCTIYTAAGDGLLSIFRGPGVADGAYACLLPIGEDAPADWSLKIDGGVALSASDADPLAPALSDLAATADPTPLAAFARKLAGVGLTPCADAVPFAADVPASLEAAKIAELTGGEKPVTVSADGFTALALWLDDRQNRIGTTTALARPGDKPPVDGPAATVIATPDALPADVAKTWSASADACARIDDASFGEADAVSVALDGDTTLYLLPCGRPGNNAPTMAIMATKIAPPIPAELPTVVEGRTSDESLAGSLAWDGRNRDLVSTWSMSAECTMTTTWPYRDGAIQRGRNSQSPGC